MTKRYDHANEERYGGAIEALDEAGKTDKAEVGCEGPAEHGPTPTTRDLAGVSIW